MSAAIAQALDKAADLVARGWCQKTYARSRNGAEVSPYSPAAVCWCLTGALDVCCGMVGVAAYPFAMTATGANYFPRWNDAPERTQAEVVAALRKAADLAREAA